MKGALGIPNLVCQATHFDRFEAPVQWDVKLQHSGQVIGTIILSGQGGTYLAQLHPYGVLETKGRAASAHSRQHALYWLGEQIVADGRYDLGIRRPTSGPKPTQLPIEQRSLL